MRRTREPGAHRAKSSVLLAALALAASILPGPAAAAPAAPRPAIERRFEAAMSAKRWREASSLADSLVRTRELRERLPARQAAAILDSLGRRLFLAGDPGAWAAAEPLFRAGLVVRELALGPDDPAVAASLATLATLFDYLGRWAEAVPLAERAVGIRSRVLGERRPETAASLRQLGLLRFQLGDYAGAATPLERSQAIYDSSAPGSRRRPPTASTTWASSPAFATGSTRPRRASGAVSKSRGPRFRRTTLPAWASGTTWPGCSRIAGDTTRRNRCSSRASRFSSTTLRTPRPWRPRD